jgi:predicted nucleotidyltransferase
MGADMNRNRTLPSSPISVPPIWWLDPQSAAGVADIAHSLALHHPEVQAVILFGSVARREEHPLEDPEPSDIDLLVVLDADTVEPGTERLSHERELALRATIGEADYRQRSPREINVFFLYRNLAGWDELFLENVARDGLLLWARGPLPEALAPIERRGLPSAFTAPHR